MRDRPHTESPRYRPPHTQDFKSIVRLLYGRPRPADADGGGGGHSVGRNVSLAVQSILRQYSRKAGGLLTLPDFLQINKRYPSLLYPVVDCAWRPSRTNVATGASELTRCLCVVRSAGHADEADVWQSVVGETQRLGRPRATTAQMDAGATAPPPQTVP